MDYTRLANRLLQDIEIIPHVNDLGIWTLDGRIGIGFVLLLESPAQEILVIRKAPREGYEFSGNLVLPGGMVRTHGNSDFEECLRYSILDRLEKEVHLSSDRASELRPIIPMVVTSYMARGDQRYTLVLPLQSNIAARTHVESRTNSVQDPRWIFWEDLIPLLKEAAPANRIIIASHLWDRMTPSQREETSASIAEAARECGGWARAVELPAFAAPWAFGLDGRRK